MMYGIVKELSAKDSREDITVVQDELGQDYQLVGEGEDVAEMAEMIECEPGLLVGKIIETRKQVGILVQPLDILATRKNELIERIDALIETDISDFNVTDQVQINAEIDRLFLKLERVVRTIFKLKGCKGVQLVLPNV